MAYFAGLCFERLPTRHHIERVRSHLMRLQRLAVLTLTARTVEMGFGTLRQKTDQLKMETSSAHSKILGFSVNDIVAAPNLTKLTGTRVQAMHGNGLSKVTIFLVDHR